MKRFASLIVLSLLLLLGWSDRSAAQLAAPRPTWTYAVFRMMTVDQRSTFQWYERDKHWESGSFEDFTKGLPFPIAGQSGSKVIDVLNAAGNVGWELATSDITRTDHSEIERFFLKQPKY